MMGELRDEIVDQLTVAGVIRSEHMPGAKPWRSASESEAEMISNAIMPTIRAHLAAVLADEATVEKYARAVAGEGWWTNLITAEAERQAKIRVAQVYLAALPPILAGGASDGR